MIVPAKSTVALPPVGAAVLFAGARDHVAAPAVVAHSAARNVIDDHPVAHAETPAAGSCLHDLAGRLVPRHHSLVSFRSLAEVLMIDAPDIGAADGRSLHAAPVPCRGAHDRCTGYRSRRWSKPSCAATPRRDPAPGPEGPAVRRCCCPANMRLSS